MVRDMLPQATALGPMAGDPVAAQVMANSRLLGYALLTDQIAPIPAYSGKPVRMLVVLDSSGIIRGVRILHHEEPILVIGVTDERLSAFTAQYLDHSFDQRFKIGGDPQSGAVVLDGISGATITMMVLNASILRAVKSVATSRGLPIDEEQLEKELTSAVSTAIASSRGSSTTNQSNEVGGDSEPIWRDAWSARMPRVWVLATGLTILTIILFVQDWLTRYPKALGIIRVAFLLYTAVFIGWFALAQLSVVNVLTFLHAAVHQFRWDTFLLEPLIFLLWCFVAISVLLWGRGVFCGWLCPFGAVQELVNKAAQRLHVPQLQLHALVHERLLAIKYVILLGLFGLSLQSLTDAVRYAEIEPFKTVFALRFDRSWPFVLYAGAMIAVSALNGKFFCKYLCPLGAALTIPTHFRIFDWLRRRKECGHPCQTCAVECPSQAIRPSGEINANECHYCLDCQVTFWNPYKCPPLVERRKKAEKRGRTLHRLPIR